MTTTNCVNCGAPLRGRVCEYCGTEYGRKKKHHKRTVCLYADNEIFEEIEIDDEPHSPIQRPTPIGGVITH